jgi:hypothetical protein
MTEREQLELSAKAAGLQLEWDYSPAQWAAMYYEGKTYHAWDPLDDEKDTLRLAKQLDQDGKVDPKWHGVLEMARNAAMSEPVEGKQRLDADTRRAIVQAAVESQLALLEN